MTTILNPAERRNYRSTSEIRLKAAHNLRKHGVSFHDASIVFFDPLSATGDDPDHSLDGRRFVTFGMSSSGRLLVVAHVEQHGAIRIITARLATRVERKLYEKG